MYQAAVARGDAAELSRDELKVTTCIIRAIFIFILTNELVFCLRDRDMIRSAVRAVVVCGRD